MKYTAYIMREVIYKGRSRTSCEQLILSSYILPVMNCYMMLSATYW